MAARKKKAAGGLAKFAEAHAPKEKTDWGKVDPEKVVEKSHGDPEPAGQRDMFAGFEKSKFNQPANKPTAYSQHEDKGRAEAIERGTKMFEDRQKEDAGEKKFNEKSEEAFSHGDASIVAEKKGDKPLALFHAKQSFKAHIEAHNMAVDRYGKDSMTAGDHGARARLASKDIARLGGKGAMASFDDSKHPRDEKGRFTGI